MARLNRISIAWWIPQVALLMATPGADAASEAVECGLYLAESTIPGAGMGIFAGREYKVGEDIGRGDICIPFIDMYW